MSGRASSPWRSTSEELEQVRTGDEGVGQIFSAVNELSRTTDKAVVSVDAMRQSAE